MSSSCRESTNGRRTVENLEKWFWFAAIYMEKKLMVHQHEPASHVGSCWRISSAGWKGALPGSAFPCYGILVFPHPALSSQCFSPPFSTPRCSLTSTGCPSPKIPSWQFPLALAWFPSSGRCLAWKWAWAGKIGKPPYLETQLCSRIDFHLLIHQRKAETTPSFAGGILHLLSFRWRRSSRESLARSHSKATILPV